MKRGKATINKQWKEQAIPRRQSFNPDREYVSDAVADYLRNGGTIQKLAATNEKTNISDKDRFLGVDNDFDGLGTGGG